MARRIEIEAKVAERDLKKSKRLLKREGRIPAVIYGGKEEPTAIHVEEKELVRQLMTGRFMNSIVSIELDGKTLRTLPKDVELHPVSNRPLHVDFLRLAKDAKVEVTIPLVFTNEDESPGLKRGGALKVLRQEIELFCEADRIPSEISVDLVGMDIGDSIFLSGITLPKGSKSARTESDLEIASIVASDVDADDSLSDEELISAASDILKRHYELLLGQPDTHVNYIQRRVREATEGLNVQ